MNNLVFKQMKLKVELLYETNK